MKQDEWGNVHFASREKQRRREREKRRRQRALFALRLKQTPLEPSYSLPHFQMFETRSGMRAVTVRMMNSLWTTRPGSDSRAVPLSLPYVEFLHGDFRA